MVQLQHNVVSLLYSIKGLVRAHFAQAEEGRFKSGEETLHHANFALSRIHCQSEHALRILKRIGLVVKQNAPAVRSKVSVLKAWQGVRPLLEKEFSSAAVEVIERIPGRFPPVRCCRDDFKEILYHLAKNAAQAMSETVPRRSLPRIGNRLAVRAQLVFTSREEPFAMITIADTGPGITDPCLGKLFQPFFTTKPEGHGTGLGLYMTKELVSKNDGHIRALSYAGCGTAFTLEFPLAGPLQKNPRNKKGAAPRKAAEPPQGVSLRTISKPEPPLE